MSEQSNSVSSALSLPLKAAGSGQAELTASAKNAPGRNSVFSNDLDQARKVQLDNAQPQPEPRNTVKEGNQASLPGLMNRLQPVASNQASQSGESALLNNSMADASAVHNVIDEPITRETDESQNSLLSAIREPLTGEAITNVTLTDNQTTTKTSADAKGNDATANTVSVERHELKSAESTPVKPLAAPQQSPATASDPIATNVAQTPDTGRSGQPVTSLNVIKTADWSVTDRRFTPPVRSVDDRRSTPPVRSGDAAQNTIKEHLPKEQATDADLRKPALKYNTALVHTATMAKEQVQRPAETISTAESRTAGRLLNTPALAELEGPGVISGRLSREQLSVPLAGKSTMEPITAPAQADTATTVKVYRSEAVTIAPEPPVSGQSGKTSTAIAEAVGFTQPAPDSAIVTQTILAGRFQRLHNGMAAPGSATSQLADRHRSTQPIVVRPNIGKTEGLVAGATPQSLISDSLTGTESPSVLTEVNPTVHQRLAATEVILSQIAQEAGSAGFRVPTAEATLLPVAGGVPSTVLVQHSEPATGLRAQAPLTLDLASEDAETTLAGNVKWMTNEGVKNAVMTVTPQGMGAISVKIGIVGDQMDVSIIASQHTTRDALESMLPRLREQLAVQGHESVKVDVSDGKNEQSRSGNGQAFSESRNPAGSTPQDNQSNSSNQGERPEHGGSDKLEVDSESVMAEDLQRVAARVAGEAGSHPVFDAYV